MVVSQIISTDMLKLKLLNVHVHSSAYVYAECIVNIRDPAFCLVPASQFSDNCKLFSVTPWSSLCLWLPKFFKYFENELGATVIFGLFAISWVILRLIFFLFWVIKCTRLACMINDLMPPYLICWWVLISSMIWRQLKSGQLREDIRS
ncbi:hypothetical protein CICLE_v10027495mg, partial [Citrus x clementina]